MGRYTTYRNLPDQAYDPRVTDMSAPVGPRRRIGNDDRTTLGDGFVNRNTANTTPIQLVGNAASIRVLPKNTRRTGLLIQNKDSTSALYIGFGVQADINSIYVAALGFILLDFTCPNTEIYAFSTSNIQAVFVDMSRDAGV